MTTFQSPQVTDLTKVGAKSGRSPSWTGLPLLGLIRVLYRYPYPNPRCSNVWPIYLHLRYFLGVNVGIGCMGLIYFTYMNGWIFMVNVGKYMPYMDGMG